MSILGTGGATSNNKERVALGVLTDYPLGLPPYLDFKKFGESTTSFSYRSLEVSTSFRK